MKDGYNCERIMVDTGTIESCCFRVCREDGVPIVFASLYLRRHEVFQSSNLDSLFNLGSDNEVIIGMDLNAKCQSWGGNPTAEVDHWKTIFSITRISNLIAQTSQQDLTL